MAIAKKPMKREPMTAPQDDQAAAAFISGAGKNTIAADADRKRVRKARVMTQFDEEVLKRVDEAAQRRGISRSAWMQFVISRALDQGEG